jgi:hypothetical protein
MADLQIRKDRMKEIEANERMSDLQKQFPTNKKKQDFFRKIILLAESLNFNDKFDIL